MRALHVASLTLVLVGLAGCTESVPETVAPTPEPAAAERTADNDTLKGAREFCGGPGGCDFWDKLYHEYVVYDLDTTILDVLVVPPATPDPLAHIEAARLSVEGWRTGIKELGAPWFTSNFTMNVHVIGQDVPPPEALADPEIIVLAAGATTTVFGIGLEPKQIACMLLGEGGTPYPVHAHDGMTVLASDCTGYGFTCLAINAAGGRGEERDLYDLISHEFGHCLGAGHVGDAGDFRSRYAPVEDIMSYQSNPDQVHCVSNMNVRVLEGVYGHLLERPETEWLPEGSFFEFEPALYEQVSCKNP